MAPDRLPSDRQMRAWRLAGRFICQCRDPQRSPLGVFDGYECRTCRHPILPERQAVELIHQTLDVCES